MKNRTDSVTELEGAILGEIARLGACTAYRLRQSFVNSRSTEWSGSTGAVYPALRRLAARGLIGGEPVPGARGGQTLSITADGRAAFEVWLADVEKAANPGLDPFRTRVGFARALAADWPDLADRLGAAVRSRLTAMDALPAADDAAEQAWREMERAAHQARLAWLSANAR